jgi:hypothetical protein
VGWVWRSLQVEQRCESKVRVMEEEMQRLQEANDGLVMANRELATLAELRNELARERAARHEWRHAGGGVADWSELQPTQRQ